MTTLTELKTTIQNEYENYSMIDKEKFDSYNTTIDTNIQSYNDRIAAIQKAEEEEAARKKAEEEAAAAAEAAARQAQSSSKSGSSGKSSSSKSGGSTGSSNKSSGSKKSSGGSNGSYRYDGWVEGKDGKINRYYQDADGNTYDSDTGEYKGNIYDWY